MDFTTLALIGIAGVLIVFMFTSSRRRKRDAEAMRERIVPGAEVMTSQGIYGTLISIDQDKLEAIVETTPGTKLRVHSQTIAKVVDEIEPVADDAQPQLNQSSAEPMSEPEFGERADKPKPAPRARKKPTE